MNILLTHSYFLRFDPKQWRQMKPYPPLGTLIAAAVLRQAGHTVRLFDPMLADSEKDILPFLENDPPDAVLFFEDTFNYLSKMCLTRMREACFTMAGYAKERGCTVIAHGSDPIDHLAEYFGNHVDVVIYGEGEQTATALFQALPSLGKNLTLPERDEILGAIEGIAFPAGNGIRINPGRPHIRNLDTLPFPAWELADMAKYQRIWRKKHGYFSINMVTTRGCPYHCNWCSKPVYGQSYQSRSPEKAAEELAALKARYSVDHIWFADDILGLKPGWLKRYREEIQRQNITIPFSCQTRADLLLKDENALEMVRAGAETVWIGAESGSQNVLDAMEKGTTVEQILECTQRLQSEGVRVAWFLQFGYIGENADDIRKTLRMLRTGKPDDIGISVSYPLPGTTFYDTVRATLERKHNWIDSGDLDIMYPGTFSPAYYRALHACVHSTFRLRQGIQALLRFDFSKAVRKRIILIPRNALLLVLYRFRMQYYMVQSPPPLAPLSKT